MRIVINREALLEPLVQAGGVVERRQTLPILANVLIQVQGDVGGAESLGNIDLQHEALQAHPSSSLHYRQPDGTPSGAHQSQRRPRPMRRQLGAASTRHYGGPSEEGSTDWR